MSAAFSLRPGVSENPTVGFDFANNVFTSVGSPDARFSVTSLPDIGRAVSALALVALENPAKVPNYVRISGSSISHSEAREITQRIRKEAGAPNQPEIVLKSEDLQEFRAKLQKERQANPDGPMLAYMLSYIKWVQKPLFHCVG